MAKRLVAVTNIKHNGIMIEFNTTLDHTLFTKEELKNLYDSGAIRLEIDPEVIPEESSVAVAFVIEADKTIIKEETPKVPEKSTVKPEDTNVKSINK